MDLSFSPAESPGVGLGTRVDWGDSGEDLYPRDHGWDMRMSRRI